MDNKYDSRKGDIFMKAVQVTGYGDVDKLKIVDIPIPEPKEKEVLVKVKACAINNTEIWMREGAYGTGSKSGWRPEGVQFPRIPGSDITGEIVKVGAQVDEAMVGKSVVLFPFTSSGEEGSEHISEDMSFIGSEYDGGYAEYVVWPADLCFDMPLADYSESAVFFCKRVNRLAYGTTTAGSTWRNGYGNGGKWWRRILKCTDCLSSVWC